MNALSNGARLAAAALALTLLGACNSGSNAAQPTATLTPKQAEHQLKQAVLQPDDLPAGFKLDVERALSNEVAAQARPDTDQAIRQYTTWGQVLLYNVQYSAPPAPTLVFNAQTARVTNSATLFASPEGATAALDYTRNLAPDTVANFLVNEGAGTKITDTQVVKDLAFPAKGDETFAWRISGKATFANGFAVNFVADAVFMRVGRIDGAVMTTALGAAPERDQLETFVDRFVQRARSAQ